MICPNCRVTMRASTGKEDELSCGSCGLKRPTPKENRKQRHIEPYRSDTESPQQASQPKPVPTPPPPVPVKVSATDPEKTALVVKDSERTITAPQETSSKKKKKSDTSGAKISPKLLEEIQAALGELEKVRENTRTLERKIQSDIANLRESVESAEKQFQQIVARLRQG